MSQPWLKKKVNALELYTIDVIYGRRAGAGPALYGAFLQVLSWLFSAAAQTRLWLYRKRILHDQPLGCLVVVVGNLTVGGTGKTPVVEKFARALRDRGRKVAILSRGYKSKSVPLWQRFWWRITHVEAPAPRIVSDGTTVLLDSESAGDEPYMLANNLKDVVVLVDVDRVKSGRFAIKEFKTDTLLLDDGLQYLRLKHRLDIVLIDRQAPFGNEYLLPRGTLREPPRNLRRASYIFITKCTGEPNDDLIARIRKYNRTAEIIECAHKPLHLQNAFSSEQLPLETLRGAFVGSLCGIAAPESFDDGLRKLGARLELLKHYTDHHRYSEAELQTFINRCLRRDLSMIVTTEKDAVRFPRLMNPEVPIYFLRVEIEILSGHESWEHCVARICQPQPMLSPERFFS